MQPLGKAELGASTFYAAAHAHDQCGTDGLPLTPNSIKILGRLQKLKRFSHPRLCQYVDIVRGKHERVMVVAEHYNNNLHLEVKKGAFADTFKALQLIHEVLQGLTYMNQHGLVHRALSPTNILLDTEGHAKLANHGLYHVTQYGACVTFPIGHPRYMAPEVLAQGPIQAMEPGAVKTPSGPKVDVWSLGVIVMEMCLGMELWSSCTLPQLISKVLLLGKHSNGGHP